MKNLLPAFLQKLKNYNPLKTKHTVPGWDDYLAARELFVKQGKNTEALLLLDEAIERGIDYALADRAFCLQELELHYDAIEDFNNAIAVFPKDANLYYGRGHSRMILTEYDNAIADLKKAIEFSHSSNSMHEQYNDDIVGKGWNSLQEFYEFQLQTILERKDSFRNPELEKMYLQIAKEIKRRNNNNN
ncbi:tetratricopeptide repeat protein [Foetidibacter luteolus]|uniref:tetratricopeptide repeat protein n=1 Tax=Foetidibacter luteolus TaxID=2608880 RepID=UPI00129BD93E|nr:hypothetical protein [Foetidibacter luteolus]